MRASLRLFVLALVAALPLGATAHAAPLLTSATLSYSDDLGPLGPFAVTVAAGPEFCGSAGAASCSGSDLTTAGILLSNDFIDFDGTSIVFAFQGGGPIEVSPGYRNLNLPGGTFTISGLMFSESGVLSGVSAVLTNVVGVTVGTGVGDEVTFTADSITFKVDTLGVQENSLGQIRLNLAIRNGTQPPPPVPEPASMLLLGSGLAVAGLVRRRRSVR